MAYKKLNILIVEDELNAREFLQKLISRNFSNYCNILATASDIQTASNCLMNNNFDVVFLDIQLGNENGFDLLKRFSQRNFQVVFTTAHKDYAIKAIKESAFDYLLKPINYIDLLAVFKKLESTNLSNSILDKLTTLDTKLSPFNDNYSKIALPINDGLKLVNLADVTYGIASGSYSEIFLVDNTKIISSKPLKYFEDVLPPNLFFRCHKSYLVNLNFVNSFNDLSKKLILINGTEIPVSIRKKEAFIHAISRI